MMITLTSPPANSRVRLVGFFQKQPYITSSELAECWLKEVGVTFSNLDVVSTNVMKYEQCHIDEEALARLEALGYTRAPFDGFSVLEGNSFEEIFNVFVSEEWQTRVGPLESKVIDISNPTLVQCEEIVHEPLSSDSKALQYLLRYRQDSVYIAIINHDLGLVPTNVDKMTASGDNAVRNIAFLSAPDFDAAIRELVSLGTGLTVLPAKVAPIVRNHH